MRVIVTGNFAQACEIAAGMIAEVVRRKPDARLGFATGSTAQGVYPFLIRAYELGRVDFSRLDTQNPATLVKMHPDATVIIDKPLATSIGYAY